MAKQSNERCAGTDRTVKVQFAPDAKVDELQAQLQSLAREIVSGLSALEPSLGKELLGGFVSELFRSAAEQERRELRRQRQAEGILAAKARGVRFGAKRIELPDGFEDMAQRWESGMISAREAAKTLGISHNTFLRRAREYCEAG